MVYLFCLVLQLLVFEGSCHSQEYQQRRTSSDIEYYRHKAGYHLMVADESYSIAKQKSRFLPHKKRKIVQLGFYNTDMEMRKKNYKSDSVMLLLYGMLVCGYDKSSLWKEVCDYLYLAVYHYEMYEFYMVIVNKG